MRPTSDPTPVTRKVLQDHGWERKEPRGPVRHLSGIRTHVVPVLTYSSPKNQE